MTARRAKGAQSHAYDGRTTVPLAFAVALADDETKQRLALVFRELAAARIGLWDPFGEPVRLVVDDDAGRR